MTYTSSMASCDWCGEDIDGDGCQSYSSIACRSCYERLEFQVPELERQIAELKAEIERLKAI